VFFLFFFFSFWLFGPLSPVLLACVWCLCVEHPWLGLQPRLAGSHYHRSFFLFNVVVVLDAFYVLASLILIEKKGEG